MTTTYDWVSPLRPDPTDIAEYTVRVRKAVSGAVTLNAIGNYRAKDVSAYCKEHDPFFNIGNDVRFHGNILAMCREMTGVIIAHDFRIQNLIVANLQAQQDDWQAQYRRLMRRHYGTEGEASARDFVEGRIDLSTLAIEYPGIEIATEAASCIITHNPGLMNDLARRTGLHCALLPLPFDVPGTTPAPDRARAGPAKPGDALDLLVFGYIGQNRCLDMICELIRGRTDVRLHLAGQIGPPELQEAIAALKRDGCPIIDHGFVEEEALDALIRESDLVLNLRHPTMGEVSGSQLRIFANGGLSVVCDTGWYGGLPEETVHKIKPDRIRRDLSGLIDQIVQDPAAFEGMRCAAHAYVKREHGLDRFAEAFTRFLSVSEEACAHGRRVQFARYLGHLYHRSGAGAFADGERLLSEAERILGRGMP